MIYEVTAELEGRLWYIEVPALDRATQARNVGEIEFMAKDLITIFTEESSPEVHVTLVLPDSVQEALDRAAVLRETEAESRQAAAQATRQAARMLREQHLTLSDVGAVLGVSHQRAQQLISA
jgi:formylmethanofuran dehydrogenase subunit E-like metal-binding protein